MLRSFPRLRTISPGRVYAFQHSRQYAPYSRVNHVTIFPYARLAPPLWQTQVRTRGKKTKASIQLDELPQGLIPLEPLPLEEPAPQYPTVVMQARSNMRKFENCVLLTRVGGFYELYFEHAEEFGPLMNLKVAQKKTNAGNVSMVPGLLTHVILKLLLMVE